MRISLATRGTTTDSLLLLSVRMESIMGRQLVDGEAKHLQERTVLGRRAERPQRRIMGRPIMAIQRPQNIATTRTNQSDSYFEQDDDDDAYRDLPDSYINDNEHNSYATQSWSTPLPSYDTVRRPEPLWQPYHMEQYDHEVETADELRHLGTFGMKPPYRFGTHEDDLLASEYTKLDPQVLVIVSSAMAGQRRGHKFLSPRHAAVVSSTNAAIHELRRVIDIDSWHKTAPFPYERMRSAPDTSFDEHGNAGSAPSYQW